LAGATGACSVLSRTDELTPPSCSDPGCVDASLGDGELPGETGAGEGGTLALTVSPNTFDVERGSSVRVSVGITRGGSFSGLVTVEVSTLPAGVTSSTQTLVASGTTDSVSLDFSASANAALGAATLTFSAASETGELHASATATVAVRGTPGT